MSIDTGTFDFTLTKPIKMAIDGHDQDVSVLTFHECGEGYDSYYFKLRKFINASNIVALELIPKFKDARKDLGIDDENESDALAAGEEIKPFHKQDEETFDQKVDDLCASTKMFLGQGDELENLVKVFGDMVSFTNPKQPICTTSCGIRVQRAAWSRIKVEDKIDMAVKYCAFFGIGLAKPESNQSDKISEFPTAVKEL